MRLEPIGCTQPPCTGKRIGADAAADPHARIRGLEHGKARRAGGRGLRLGCQCQTKKSIGCRGVLHGEAELIGSASKGKAAIRVSSETPRSAPAAVLLGHIRPVNLYVELLGLRAVVLDRPDAITVGHLTTQPAAEQQ